MNYKGREILAYLSVTLNGNWGQIYEELVNRKEYNEEEVHKVLSELKYSYTTILDDEYPEGMKHMERPPFVIFYIGDISLIKDTSKNISVVGSRDCTEYGVAATQSIIKGLTKDYNIVSGGARGIDTIAHESALEYGGKTIAVMPGGLDNLYPKQNNGLFRKIRQKGLILTEYPPNVLPIPSQFPIRNRLISYLSDSLLVTEAYEYSGTSITINCSLTSNKEIMCVPYGFDSNSLCNKLIKDGAFLVENADDVRYVLSKTSH